MKVLSVVGRIGSIELKQTNGGGVLNVSVACDYQKKNQAGGYDRHTLWVRCVVFGKRAESLSKVLTKGMRCAASGDMQIDEYNAKNGGEKRYSVEIIANDIEPLFDKREGGAPAGERPGAYGGDGFASNSDDTDIPF